MDWQSPIPEILNRFSAEYEPGNLTADNKLKLKSEVAKSQQEVPDHCWPRPLPLSAPLESPTSTPKDSCPPTAPPSSHDGNVAADEPDPIEEEIQMDTDALFSDLMETVETTETPPSGETGEETDEAHVEAQLAKMQAEKQDVATVRGADFDAQMPDFKQTFAEEMHSVNEDAAPQVEGIESQIRPIGTVFGGLAHSSNGWSSMRCRFHPTLSEGEWRDEAIKEARQNARLVRAPSASKETLDGKLESCCEPPPDYARIIITLSEAFQVELFRNRVNETPTPVKAALEAVAQFLAVPIGEGRAESAIPRMAYSDAHPLSLMACGRYHRQYHGRFLLDIESGKEASSLAATRFVVSRDYGESNMERDLRLLNCLLRRGLIMHEHIHNLVSFCMQSSFWVEERERKCIASATIVCNNAHRFGLRISTAETGEEFQGLVRQCLTNGFKHNFVRFVAEGHLKRADSGYGLSSPASPTYEQVVKALQTNLNNILGQRGAIPNQWDAVFLARTIWVARKTGQWDDMLLGKRVSIECADDYMANTWRSIQDFVDAYQCYKKTAVKIYPHDYRDEVHRGSKTVFEHYRQVHSALRGKWSVTRSEAMALVKYTADATFHKPSIVSVETDRLSFVTPEGEKKPTFDFQPGDVYKRYFMLAAGAYMTFTNDTADGGLGGAFAESHGKIQNMMKSFFAIPVYPTKFKGNFKGLFVPPPMTLSNDFHENLIHHAAMARPGICAQKVCKSATISRISTEHKLGTSELAQFDQFAMNAEQKAAYQTYMDQAGARKQALTCFASAVQTVFSGLGERGDGDSIAAAWLRDGGERAAEAALRTAMDADDFDDLDPQEEASMDRIGVFWRLIVELDNAHYKPWKAVRSTAAWTLEQHMALARLLKHIFSKLDAAEGALVDGAKTELVCCAPPDAGLRYENVLDAVECMRATPELQSATHQLANVLCSVATLPRKDPATASQKRKRAFETVHVSTPTEFAVQCAQYLNEKCLEDSKPLLDNLRQTSNKFEQVANYDLESELAAGQDRSRAIGAENSFETTVTAHRNKHEKRVSIASTGFKSAKEKFREWKTKQAALFADLEEFKAAGDEWKSLAKNQVAVQYAMHLDDQSAKKKTHKQWQLHDPAFSACMLPESSDAMAHVEEQYSKLTK